MHPLENLKALEAAATPRPWRVASYPSGTVNVELPNGFWFASIPRKNCVGYGEVSDDDCQATRTLDSHLIRDLRNLAPELLALWEAGIEVGRAFDALAATGGEDEALGDQMHLKFVAFAEAMNTLNRKTAAL